MSFPFTAADITVTRLPGVVAVAANNRNSNNRNSNPDVPRRAGD